LRRIDSCITQLKDKDLLGPVTRVKKKKKKKKKNRVSGSTRLKARAARMHAGLLALGRDAIPGHRGGGGERLIPRRVGIIGPRRVAPLHHILLHMARQRGARSQRAVQLTPLPKTVRDPREGPGGRAGVPV